MDFASQTLSIGKIFVFRTEVGPNAHPNSPPQPQAEGAGDIVGNPGKIKNFQIPKSHFLHSLFGPDINQ